MDIKVPGPSLINCKLKIQFSDNSHNFDNSWNVQIDKFTFVKVDDRTTRVNFSFLGQLHSSEQGQIIVLIPGENMEELMHELERLESLLDLISLHILTPLEIVNGSIECSGVGGSSNAVTNTLVVSLNDIEGLKKRYQNLLNNSGVLNALRFFRFAKIDKEFSGKGTKLWSVLEALYKGYEREEKTILSKLSKVERMQIRDVINGQVKLSIKDRERIINTLDILKLSSKSTLLSKKLKLMNKEGDYPDDYITKLISWWSDARNAPAHGERVKIFDRGRQEAIKDMESTIESLLTTSISPSMLGFFIGHPEDLDGNFWDKDDYTIFKFSTDCWAHPVSWESFNYLLKIIPHHKKRDYGPLLFVTHNSVRNVVQKDTPILDDLSILPENYQKLIIRIQKKLNS